jgi:membrane associated rhomboid family serine protease
MNSWTSRLILANVVMFILTNLQPGITTHLMFVPALLLEQPWTLFTYMFLHDGTFHILFNMLGLFFFGPRLEEELGSQDFLFLYFISGITGGLLSFVTPTVAIVGASAAVYGIFLAFAMIWPREQLLIWGIVPVEARYLVVVMTVLSLFGGLSGGGNIAHFAHLGGFLGGFVYLKVRARNSPLRRFEARVAPPPMHRLDIERARRIDRSALHEVNRTELDRILAKIDVRGIGGLTPVEQQFLDRFSAL